MNLSTKNQNRMNRLVDELTKECPNLQIVKDEMAFLGLKYTEDPIDQLKTVLMSLHPQIDEKEVFNEL